jgi:hypothetical protein
VSVVSQIPKAAKTGALLPIAAAVGAGAQITTSSYTPKTAWATTHCRRYGPTVGNVDTSCYRDLESFSYGPWQTPGQSPRITNWIDLQSDPAYTYVWYSSPSPSVHSSYGYGTSEGSSIGAVYGYCERGISYGEMNCGTSYY